VLTYPRIRKRLQYSEEQINRFVLFLEQAAIVVDTSTPMPAVTADADNDKFIALALVGESQYVVSGDDHLLRLGHYQSITILKPAAFLRLWQMIRRDPPPD
jgi:predicted nucleic acid-binding protein